MSAVSTPFPTPGAWTLPYRGKVAMASLIMAETAIFTIFVVAYLFYVGKSLSGPTPSEVLETHIFYTICLLSSSLTVHLAAKSIARDKVGEFLSLLSLTILLGGLFMYGTAWHRLIYEKGLTISTNLSGLPDFPGVPVWVTPQEHEFIRQSGDMDFCRLFTGINYVEYGFEGGRTSDFPPATTFMVTGQS